MTAILHTMGPAGVKVTMPWAWRHLQPLLFRPPSAALTTVLGVGTVMGVLNGEEERA